MIKLLISSILRHVLSGVGGAVVAQGVVTQDQLTTVIGAATTLGGVAYSAWKNYQAKQTKGAK